MSNNSATNRPRSKGSVLYPVPQRLRIISEVIRDSIGQCLESDGVPHLLFLVVHGINKKTRKSDIIAQPHWDTGTVEDIFRESLSTYDQWGGDEEFEGMGLVTTAVESLLKAIETMALREESFSETAVLCAYPGGAAMIGFLRPRGASSEQMRRMIFDALDVPYPRKDDVKGVG